MENSKQRKIIDNKYIIKKQIGNGAQGEIYLVEKNKENNELVVKVINPGLMEKDEKINFLNEIEILQKLSNKEKKYVPFFYESGEGFLKRENEDESNLVKRLYLVIDYAEKGDLFYYFEKAAKGFKEKHAKVIFKKIVEDIKYCHEHNICHLDIKIGNILLNHNYEPIITDFGLSKLIFDEKGIPIKYKNISGTPHYMSPQILELGTYSGSEADIFSLGVVLFNLVTGDFGFQVAHLKDKSYGLIIRRNILKYWNSISDRIPHVSSLSEEFKDLYLKMIAYRPEKRPSIEEILKHPWMQEINDMNEDQLTELNNEIIEEFMNLEDKKNDANITIETTQDTANIEPEYISRGDDSLEEKYDMSIKIKQIKLGDKFANNYIKINGNIIPHKFMNSLVESIQNKFDDDCTIIRSKEKLKFEVYFDLNKKYDIEQLEEFDNSCVMKVKLYEEDKGGYLVNFIKVKGDIEDYHEYFLKIQKIIKELLN